MSSSQITPKPLQIAAAVIGNALEWYDFIVFGFFTVVIARLFFPSDSQYASLLLTTGTFGVGFFMRPVGGILLGIYADRRGRKAALLMVITLMTVAIAMIAFAPTYAAIGVGAPLIMVVARLLQGFSAGGRSVWRLQRPDIDGIGRAISDPRALNRARHRLQHCGHAVWRLCTVLRDLADPSDRHADRAGILSDVRRGGWTAGGLIPEGTSP